MDKNQPTSSKLAHGKTPSKVVSSTTKPLTESQKQLITSSWRLIQMYMETNSIELFVSFFKSHPQYIAYFKDLKDMNPNDMNADANLRAHAFTVFYALSALLDRGFKDGNVLNAQMRKIINRHLDRGVLPEHFEDFFKSMMDWLRWSIGQDYTDELQNAWTALLDIFRMKVKTIQQERSKT